MLPFCIRHMRDGHVTCDLDTFDPRICQRPVIYACATKPNDNKFMMVPSVCFAHAVGLIPQLVTYNDSFCKSTHSSSFLM